MTDELRRAFEFMQYADMAGTRVETFRHGKAVFTPELPRRHDSNYLVVDALPGEVEAGDLAAEAERLQGAAGLGHRILVARDAATAERLAPGFADLGWETTWNVVMAHHREPERPVDSSLAVETEEEVLRAAREADLRQYPWATPEVISQVLGARKYIPVETRYYAVFVDGEPVSWTELYLDRGVGQVEAVATIERHRNRGYASAVVVRAVEEARRAGADLVFLGAMADDWPRQLYARLGFDVIGGYVKFLRVT